ncbi:Hypothetical protein SMAX5B_020327, partial [Scophthalmus maximus]
GNSVRGKRQFEMPEVMGTTSLGGLGSRRGRLGRCTALENSGHTITRHYLTS